MLYPKTLIDSRAEKEYEEISLSAFFERRSHQQSKLFLDISSGVLKSCCRSLGSSPTVRKGVLFANFTPFLTLGLLPGVSNR
ncbi:MAG TPA: hypothetical protein VIW64_02820 [Pyrinomonadaceae bacterium]